MPSYDFEVDLQALAQAAQGLAEACDLFRVDDVVDLVPTEADLGSDIVWSAVGEFKDRWERGMNNLVGDVQELSGRLGKVVMNYAELDQDGSTTFDGVTAELRGLRVMQP